MSPTPGMPDLNKAQADLRFRVKRFLYFDTSRADDHNAETCPENDTPPNQGLFKEWFQMSKQGLLKSKLITPRTQHITKK